MDEIDQHFTSDQIMTIMEWLQTCKDSGLTLDDVLAGLESGILTEPANIP